MAEAAQVARRALGGREGLRGHQHSFSDLAIFSPDIDVFATWPWRHKLRFCPPRATVKALIAH
jgi:hypothetical protein